MDESEPFLPGHPRGPLLGDASLSEDDAGVIDAGGVPLSRVGGLWVSCYEHFKPSGEPLKDVTRLGLMCGPSNGLTMLGETRTGKVAQGAKERSAHSIRATADSCYRIFAVAGGTVKDLDVTVSSSRGSRLTGDDSEHAWPIVEPERPFCTFDDDTFQIDVASGEGSGPYALQIWRLAARN